MQGNHQLTGQHAADIGLDYDIVNSEDFEHFGLPLLPMP
jgi:hypothetical protein